MILNEKVFQLLSPTKLMKKNTWLEQLSKAGNTSTLVQMEKWKWNLSEKKQWGHQRHH